MAGAVDAAFKAVEQVEVRLTSPPRSPCERLLIDKRKRR